MKNQKSKNPHDKLEAIVNRSNKVSCPKNYLPIAIGEFGKELYENEVLHDIRQDIANEGKEYFIPLRIANDKVLHTLNQVAQTLRSHALKFPRLSPYLLKYDAVIKNNIPGSYTLVDQLEQLLRSAITEISYDHMYFQASQITIANPLAIKHKVDEYVDHSDVLPHLIISNNAGKIVFVYSKDLSDWYIEFNIFERNQTTTVFYSFHYLTTKYALCYDIRKRPSRIYNLEEEIIAYKKKDAFNFDLAIQTNTTAEALAHEVDIEECKVCVDRVWEFIKPRLFSEPDISNWISFISKGTTIIVKSSIGEKSFSTQDRTGRFIKVFAKNPHETITDKLLWKKIEQLSVEEELDGQQKDQLNNTYKSVNKELKKIGLLSTFQKTTPKDNVIQKLWLNPSLQVK
ncbi:hypothetical protein [Candidatus Chromulinivorax destructor]|uniref:Uncharacterized protein n=1 Tax=Candidatus Chromulinivorax destructor TaxID=2066483 RepID=A0A345ZCZ5_9BACT|nr:hypothetical protein [Candidatus Chromulinivorax destructor]AXK61162.1 hypothetical protein C0J27_05530 [Candidatus Chromulinivorax destructor]